ncbi:hypothetical protein LAJ19_21235 (plasmid) [Deinococcus taeanensis]|uniref:hypothetical protein n=1 Tax=Deinococcus taeanensis TaxID=2737050 RepID=UPI001CDBBE8F|nr:hypothetical protein [Deinococcus taeanensis]UBV45316.1 hypothetical protein LAJ19_21235 [Deinococcus taeanensis]
MKHLKALALLSLLTMSTAGAAPFLFDGPANSQASCVGQISSFIGTYDGRLNGQIRSWLGQVGWAGELTRMFAHSDCSILD